MSKITISKYKYKWIAKHIANGWRVRLDIGRAGKFPIRGLVLASKEEVLELFPEDKVEFIERPSIRTYSEKETGVNKKKITNKSNKK